MAEEKSQGAGTATEEAPGENTVQITFLPEGKTVQYEHGKLPYEDHGKEQSLLDVALNFGVTLDWTEASVFLTRWLSSSSRRRWSLQNANGKSARVGDRSAKTAANDFAIMQT